MNLVAVPVTVIAGAYRRQGWRPTLQDGGITVWRCACDRPHATTDAADACGLAALRARLGRRAMRVWWATYRRQPQFTPAEIERMDEAREMVVLEIQTNPNLPAVWHNQSNIPTKQEEVMAAVAGLRDAIFAAKNTDEIRQHQHTLKVLRELFDKQQLVREACELGLMDGEWVIGGWLVADEENEAIGTRGQLAGTTDGTGSGAIIALAPEERPLTVIEKTGNRGPMYPWRLKELAGISLDQLHGYAAVLHNKKREATLSGIVDLKRTDETRARRHASLYAEPFPEGMEYRIGNNRDTLNDVEDESVSVIITDPPYGRDSADNFEWLGPFADRVLMQGGSLICYTGTGMVLRDGAILSRYLNYKWMGVLLHADAQKMLGAGIRAGFKPILWFTKGPNRRIVHGRKTLVPDVLNDRRAAVSEEEFLEQTDSGRALSTKDKSLHGWAQGDAGVRVWVHHLSSPGELIIDPFCGTGEWGDIACREGRRWIGCDIRPGGTTTVVTDELDDVTDTAPVGFVDDDQRGGQ